MQLFSSGICVCVCGGGYIVVFVPLGVIVFWMRALLVLSTGPCQAGCSAQPHQQRPSFNSLDVLNIVLLEESNLCEEEQWPLPLLLHLVLLLIQRSCLLPAAQTERSAATKPSHKLKEMAPPERVFFSLVVVVVFFFPHSNVNF